MVKLKVQGSRNRVVLIPKFHINSIKLRKHRARKERKYSGTKKEIIIIHKKMNNCINRYREKGKKKIERRELKAMAMGLPTQGQAAQKTTWPEDAEPLSTCFSTLLSSNRDVKT